MYTKLSLLLRSSFLSLLTSIFLTACGSSDTAETGIGSGTATGVDMGDVTLLITDAPTSAYDEVNVVAESVSLVGEGHEAPLLKKHTRFNLLDLRNTFRKLSKSRCRVGTYSKVRFRIRDVELVKYEWDPDKLEHIRKSVTPRLEKNMVDLNARTQFAVDRLRKLIVKLDLDADKSLSTDPENNDEPVFNPDVTVDVDSVPTDTELPPQEVTPVLMNQQGVARNIQADSLQLCDPDQPTDCVQVNVGAETVVMDEVINVVGIGDITENTLLQVIGHLDVNTDAINALHVLKDGSRVNTYSGTLSGAVVNDSINFDITAGAQAGTTYPVTPASLAGVYDSAGNVLDINALGDGVSVEVIGFLSTFPPPGGLKPGVIIISTP